MIFGSITELGIALTDLADNHAYWSQATFGKDGERGPQEGALRHLAKEAVEALEAWEALCTPASNPDKVRMELADCLLLLLDASRRAGLSPMGLIQAGLEKLKINQSRKWPSPIDGQPCEHVKDGAA